jgi:hypothetical protein
LLRGDDQTFRGVVEMKTGFVVALALATALVAGHGAFAFQEQKGSTPPPAEAAPAPAEAAPGEAKAGMADDSAPKGEAGTEIRIPGLGKLGVLPKMDFGLELLYGAAETPVQPVPSPSPEDDLTVRGSVKHRF